MTPIHIYKNYYLLGEEFDAPGIYKIDRQKFGRVISLPILCAPSPADFKEKTMVIAKNQSEYRPIPAYRFDRDENGRLVFCWRLSWWHRIKLLFTGKIWQQVMTFNGPLQPQLIMTEKPDMPKHEHCACCK